MSQLPVPNPPNPVAVTAGNTPWDYNTPLKTKAADDPLQAKVEKRAQVLSWDDCASCVCVPAPIGLGPAHAA